MRSVLVASTLALLVSAVGCESSSPVEALEGSPQMSFSNGPSVLPNVFRFEGILVVGVIDVEADLAAVAGVPADRSTHPACGGDAEPTIAVQDAGQIQGVIHRLMSDGDVPIGVYRWSTFSGYCVTEPLAHGTGRITSTDNDLTFSGTRTNSWGYNIGGDVTVLETGESQRLNAHARFRARNGASVGSNVSVRLH